MSQGKLKTIQNPESFFLELIQEGTRRQNLYLKSHAFQYLVSILVQFIKSDQFFYQDEKGKFFEQPFVFILKEALEAERKEHKKKIFRYLGDLSLYKSGFFQERLQKKRITIPYCIYFGKMAYHMCAALSREEKQKEIFLDLATLFPKLVEVFLSVSEQTTTIQSEKDLLYYYQLWDEIQNPKAAYVLQKAGMIPVKKKKNYS